MDKKKLFTAIDDEHGCKLYGHENEKSELIVDRVEWINPNTAICGLCKWYDNWFLWCEKHLNWGEMVEMDTCDDYEEM